MDELTLTNRVAVVTGGSRGIARQGAAVAICYREREEAAQETAELIRQRHVKALALRCDVSDEASVGEFFGRVRSDLGSIDILVNNAGIARDGLFMYLDRKRWNEVLDVACAELLFHVPIGRERCARLAGTRWRGRVDPGDMCGSR